MSDPITIATRHGHVLIPIEGKAPRLKGWPDHPGLSPAEARDRLHHGGNVGMLCGQRSGRLLIVDVDGERPEGLTETPTVQTGGGGLHLYYRVPDGVDLPTANKCGVVAEGVDIRYTGAQVVYPGSVHPETGALYEWVPGMSPDDLPVADVPQWVLDALLSPAAAPVPAAVVAEASRDDRYLTASLDGACLDIRTAPEGQRNDTLNTRAFAMAGLPFPDPDAVRDALIAAGCEAGLSEFEARKTVQSGMAAGREKPRAVSAPAPRTHGTSAAAVEAEPAPQTEENHVLCPQPLPMADKYLAQFHPHGTLRHWRDSWYQYTGTHFEVITTKRLASEFAAKARRWHYFDDRDELHQVYTKIRSSLTNDAVTQMMQPGRTIIEDRRRAPMWLDGNKGRPPASEFIAVRNGLLHIPTRELRPHTPAYFTTTALPFDYSPDADSPETWVNFLTGAWPGDDGVECAALLAEWFGYCLSNDMSQHKMLWLIGARRAGKGIISRILSTLLDEDNVCTPVLGALADQFGAQSLIDKRLAIFPDARLDGRGNTAIISERLLSMSGGDKQTIQRKRETDWIGPATAKVMLLSNELPHIPDSSGAMLSRLLFLHMKVSHAGREDRGLEARIRREMPGILNWALDGYDRLARQGQFTEPRASRQITMAYRAASNPVGTFVEECCEVAEGVKVSTHDIYERYRRWCQEEGAKPMEAPRFGKELLSAVPILGKSCLRIGSSRIWHYTGIALVNSTEDIPL